VNVITDHWINVLSALTMNPNVLIQEGICVPENTVSSNLCDLNSGKHKEAVMSTVGNVVCTQQKRSAFDEQSAVSISDLQLPWVNPYMESVKPNIYSFCDSSTRYSRSMYKTLLSQQSDTFGHLWCFPVCTNGDHFLGIPPHHYISSHISDVQRKAFPVRWMSALKNLLSAMPTPTSRTVRNQGYPLPRLLSLTCPQIQLSSCFPHPSPQISFLLQPSVNTRSEFYKHYVRISKSPSITLSQPYETVSSEFQASKRASSAQPGPRQTPKTLGQGHREGNLPPLSEKQMVTKEITRNSLELSSKVVGVNAPNPGCMKKTAPMVLFHSRVGSSLVLSGSKLPKETSSLFNSHAIYQSEIINTAPSSQVVPVLSPKEQSNGKGLLIKNVLDWMSGSLMFWGHCRVLATRHQHCQLSTLVLMATRKAGAPYIIQYVDQPSITPARHSVGTSSKGIKVTNAEPNFKANKDGLSPSSLFFPSNDVFSLLLNDTLFPGHLISKPGLPYGLPWEQPEFVMYQDNVLGKVDHIVPIEITKEEKAEGSAGSYKQAHNGNPTLWKQFSEMLETSTIKLYPEILLEKGGVLKLMQICPNVWALQLKARALHMAYLPLICLCLQTKKFITLGKELGHINDFHDVCTLRQSPGQSVFNLSKWNISVRTNKENLWVPVSCPCLKAILGSEGPTVTFFSINIKYFKIYIYLPSIDFPIAPLSVNITSTYTKDGADEGESNDGKVVKSKSSKLAKRIANSAGYVGNQFKCVTTELYADSTSIMCFSELEMKERKGGHTATKGSELCKSNPADKERLKGIQDRKPKPEGVIADQNRERLTNVVGGVSIIQRQTLFVDNKVDKLGESKHSNFEVTEDKALSLMETKRVSKMPTDQEPTISSTVWLDGKCKVSGDNSHMENIVEEKSKDPLMKAKRKHVSKDNLSESKMTNSSSNLLQEPHYSDLINLKVFIELTGVHPKKPCHLLHLREQQVSATGGKPDQQCKKEVSQALQPAVAAQDSNITVEKPCKKMLEVKGNQNWLKESFRSSDNEPGFHVFSSSPPMKNLLSSTTSDKKMTHPSFMSALKLDTKQKKIKESHQTDIIITDKEGDCQSASLLQKNTESCEKPSGKRLCKTKHLISQENRQELSMTVNYYMENADGKLLHSRSPPEATQSCPMLPEAQRLIVNKNAGETLLQRASRLGYE
ncbi:LOW QUALITY PROTEIN: BCL-6 corepressor, partial [Galemys pyrenaicus]